MRRLSAAEVHAQKVAELGLDNNAVDLTSIEAIAGALRRTASFLCPCSAATLVRGVVRPLRGLVDDLETARCLAEETLEAIIAHGDILEHCRIDEDPGAGTAALLYAAPASFVARQTGAVILLGIASDQLSALPDELETRVEYVAHVRRLTAMPGENLRNDLVQLGLVDLPSERWLNSPTAETCVQQVSRWDGLLDAAQPSRDIPGLSLLDPESPVRYYRGRWVQPRSQTGRFVARRRQAYGSDLWCYVQMRDGNPERMLDFPSLRSRWRGCDEAWHLQMAIDSIRGKAQQFRTRVAPADTRVLEFFSPVPMWARRRWDAIGETVPGTGCLFAYRIAETEVHEELRFAREALWLDEWLQN